MTELCDLTLEPITRSMQMRGRICVINLICRAAWKTLFKPVLIGLSNPDKIVTKIRFPKQNKIVAMHFFKTPAARSCRPRPLYNTNFSRGGNVRYIRELGFCAKFSSRENNIHCEWNFAKFSSREIVLPRNFPPRENKIIIAV